jgi:hypothetical protein
LYGVAVQRNHPPVGKSSGKFSTVTVENSVGKRGKSRLGPGFRWAGSNCSGFVQRLWQSAAARHGAWRQDFFGGCRGGEKMAVKPAKEFSPQPVDNAVINLGKAAPEAGAAGAGQH